LSALEFLNWNGLGLTNELIKNFEIPEPEAMQCLEPYKKILQIYFQFIYNVAFDFGYVWHMIARNACLRKLLNDLILLQNPVRFSGSF